MGLRDRLSASAAEIKARSQRLVELNVELLTTELKRKGQQYGSAIGLFVGAGVLALYLLGFALATIAVVLYIWLPLWLSLLIVTAALLLIVLILALVGRSRMRQAKTIRPERAIAEAKSTAGALKAKMQQTASDLTPRRNGKARPACRRPAGMPGRSAHAPRRRPPAAAPPRRRRSAADAPPPHAAHHAARRATPRRGGPLMADKIPQRSPDKIAGDIAAERRGLEQAFDSLRGDMSDAAAADNPTLAKGRKAALLVPALVIAAGATAAGLIAGLRSQSEKAGEAAQRSRSGGSN